MCLVYESGNVLLPTASHAMRHRTHRVCGMISLFGFTTKEGLQTHTRVANRSALTKSPNSPGTRQATSYDTPQLYSVYVDTWCHIWRFHIIGKKCRLRNDVETSLSQYRHTAASSQQRASLKREKWPAFPYGVLRRFAEICGEETTACSEHTQVL